MNADPRRAHHPPDSYCGVVSCQRCESNALAVLEEYGCCDSWHPVSFQGDCRDDCNRFASPESYIYWRVTGRRDDLSRAALTRLGLRA